MDLRDHVLVRACRVLNQGIDGGGWLAMGHRQKSWVRTTHMVIRRMLA
jgi:hypothetical protein